VFVEAGLQARFAQADLKVRLYIGSRSALFNMHGASVDQEGNLYVAEGANPAFLIGPPVYAAWKK
jgi:hypothetical protein